MPGTWYLVITQRCGGKADQQPAAAPRPRKTKCAKLDLSSNLTVYQYSKYIRL